MKYMKKVASPVDMEKLPGDVLSNIFIRLLAKQLAQMRLVCKTWNALLSESSFIKYHLLHSIHNNNKKDEILLFFQKAVFPDFYSGRLGPLTARSTRSPRLELTDLTKLEFPINPQHEDPLIDVIGCVNGLICFSYATERDYNYFIRIWNPSLSVSLTLPPSPFSYNSCYHLGFGFDPKTDDYKVVNLAGFHQKPTQQQCEVYSMKKGSWELISQKVPSHIKGFIHQNEVCLNGHIHWLCVTDLELWPRPQTILTFDLSAMTYGEIPLPESMLPLHDHRYRFNVLGVLSEKLCLMSRISYGQCDVWVMDDDDDSWVKHHVFSQFSDRITPYGFTSHEEFFFQVDEGCRFALYDPNAAKIKIFKIEMRDPLDSLIIFKYVDSLVWIARCSVS
ncbi:putative F-box protein At3g16210 [Lactuca sativa]|uniref:F-box domain-containing protein n=1 Tax=Lactuca sativa TaxID=4236 RepID=A0A9R1UXA8_LACSA|nr:putative F-box protein At3g16210 [Lactuca sativa]XP_042753096.1 putative F-box protein At3g16210 [Lactuca sativa]KAJ0192589.1 hypothetical protein LSAT_V11C800393040 [Lactuca sativa]KAJ0194523.1 hypothetical protein LSAT_V11C800393020 [Lactuca sativa]